MTTGRPLAEAPGPWFEGESFDVRVFREGLGHGRGGEGHQRGDDKAAHHPVSPSVFELAVEAGRRIAAARFHVAEGLRALDDAHSRFADPIASTRLPAVTPRCAGANCPEDRSKRPPGFSFADGNAVIHGSNLTMETVR